MALARPTPLPRSANWLISSPGQCGHCCHTQVSPGPSVDARVHLSGEMPSRAVAGSCGKCPYDFVTDQQHISEEGHLRLLTSTWILGLFHGCLSGGGAVAPHRGFRLPLLSDP